MPEQPDDGQVNRTVLRMNVPVTATPYADASDVEVPNPITITSTATELR
jgi:hypothetical protein